MQKENKMPAEWQASGGAWASRTPIGRYVARNRDVNVKVQRAQAIKTGAF